MRGAANGIIKAYNSMINTKVAGPITLGTLLGFASDLPTISLPTPHPSSGGSGSGGSGNANLGSGRFQAGGIVPGPYSMPRAIEAHGSEMILTPRDQQGLLDFIRSANGAPAAAAGASARGATVVNQTFNFGNVSDPDAVARQVRATMADLMGVA
jgi:hypothetical protein